jgi:hypothetical protein
MGKAISQLRGGKAPQKQPEQKKKGSAISQLRSSVPAKGVNKHGQDVSGHVMNPLNPKNQLKEQAPPTSLIKNFGKSLKEFGKIALELPKGMVDQFRKPSETTKALEGNLFPVPKDAYARTLTAPLRTAAKGFTRLVAPGVEGMGSQIGNLLAEHENAKKVVRGELPQSVLRTEPVNRQDVVDTVMNTANTVLSVYSPKFLDDAGRRVFAGESPKPKASTAKKPTKPVEAPKRAYEPFAYPDNVKVSKNYPEQKPGTTRFYSTKGVDGELRVGDYLDSNINEHLARGSAKEIKQVFDIPDTELGRLVEDSVGERSALGIRIATTPEVNNYRVFKSNEPQYKPVNTPEFKQPEIKTSKLAQGVADKALEKKLADGFEGLPEYAVVNVKDQVRAAKELVTLDREKAVRVALGQELPPEGILPESVFKVVEDEALKNGDVNLLRELATESHLTTEATGMGQRIRMLAERDPHSAVRNIREVIKAKEAAVQRRYGKVGEAKAKVKASIKSEVKKAAPKAKDWAGFLEELKCN